MRRLRWPPTWRRITRGELVAYLIGVVVGNAGLYLHMHHDHERSREVLAYMRGTTNAVREVATVCLDRMGGDTLALPPARPVVEP